MPTWKLNPIRGQSKAVVLSDNRVTIGRGAENVIPLIDEQASRKHALVEPDGRGGYKVRDLGSRNGTRLNEVRVEESPLKSGDVIRVGQHEFVVLVEGLREDAVKRVNVNTAVEDAPPEVTGSAPMTASREVGWMFELAEAMRTLPPNEPPEAVSLIDANGVPSDVLGGTSDGPNAIRMLLQLASKSRATDVHFEAKGEFYNIRMRVDGEMVPIIELPKRVGELSHGVVRSACHMQSAGRDAVQDGHFSSVFPDRRVEYRVSFTPSMQGQKLVLRVLDQRGAPSTMSDLGLAGYMHDRLRQVCEQDSGLILTCGPTGSGKTTTLYNAIREIDRQARNVITIEDPVEYQLSGVTQIPVDEAKGNNFGTLLRSVLRQDPDVILVGEVRDEETARTAMQAALTGHLVFSSVHSKDSITAVFRLLDLKVEPYLVANSLNLVLAQRLVRTLCSSCKQLVPLTPGQATRIGRWVAGKTSVYASTGCGKCLRTGYRGRRALFEMLDFNDELRDIVLNKPSIAAMKKVIEAGLFTTLQQSGWKMVAEGATTIDEVERVAGMT
ncbi:MAG TPA: ATPase, T2SS/T4P/T4SS family [Phycisphaerales bacterium]|nr:ATPase, T2SS/T4P/T4SS family [Phycisphaerales bacterium]